MWCDGRLWCHIGAEMTISPLLRAKNVYYCLARKFPMRLLLCDLDLSIFPQSTYFAHPYGVTLNARARFGENCLIRQNVTVGYRWKTDGSECGARIGNNVRLEAGCIVLGPVLIGDGAIVGAGAVVLHDVPAGAVVVGNPARVVGCKNGGYL